MSDQVECVVVGAGVVGLAIARALALEGHEVLVLEAEDGFGTQTSSRNSEVIHAGIYYPTDSLKAGACVRGKELLYAYCQRRGIDHRRLGKLIVATNEEQLEIIKGYQAQGLRNGVNDLELLSQHELRRLEPQVKGLAALWSPSTGVVDSHALMLSLVGDLENAGGTLATRSPVRRFARSGDGFEIEVEVDGTPERLRSRLLVNSAGHGAVALARASGSDHPTTASFLVGHYFSYSGKSPLKHLVYPVAAASSLGIHATIDLGGRLKFGPDADWREGLDYGFDMSDRRRQRFVTSIRKYFPAVDADRLQPGYVGIRPKITGPGEQAADFVIAGPERHGVPGLVQLFGIESPGLTGSLAIAELVVDRLHV